MNHEIILYEGDPIVVTESRADQINLQMQRGAKHIYLPSHTVSVGNIKDIQRTSRRSIDPSIIQIGEVKKPRPQYTEDGVKAAWCKKEISDKEWKGHYAASPGFHLLDRTERGVTIGFLRATTGASLPTDIEYCTPAESQKLEIMVSVHD